MSKPPQRGESKTNQASPSDPKPIIRVTSTPQVESQDKLHDDKHNAPPKKADRVRLGDSKNYLTPWKNPGTTSIQKSTGADLDPRLGPSINSIRSLGSNARIGTRRVRFLDRLSWRSISAISFKPAEPMPGELTFFEEFKNPIQLFGIEDPTYLPGFADLYHMSEITISESVCCCCNDSYKITDSNKKSFYYMDREDDGVCTSILKWLCPCNNLNLMRAGFTINVFNSAISTHLITFQRRTHFIADQLDIVETFYSIEDSHVGRIERTDRGYRIINEKGDETFRIFYQNDAKKTLTAASKVLHVTHSETMELAAIINYYKRRCWGNVCPCGSFDHTIKWMGEIDVAAKVLMIGALMFELNSNEKFVDLPLGGDAVRTLK